MSEGDARKSEPGGVDVRRLKYFVAVCNNGGFSRAASAIGVAQPALTRQVKLLEREIGLPLINRTGRGAEPTEEGKFLLSRSLEYLKGLEGIVLELRQRFSKLNGQIVIGICPTISPFFVEDLKSHTRANSPNLSLSFIEAYSGDLKNLMANDRLDLALTYKPGRQNGYRLTELFSEKLTLLAGYSADAPQRSYSLAEISRLKLILPSRIHELRVIIDRVCRRQGVLLRPELELDSLDAVKSVLLKKPLQYYTILPSHGLTVDASPGLFSSFDIDDPKMLRTIAIVEPRKPRNADITAFLVDHIRERARSIKAATPSVF